MVLLLLCDSSKATESCSVIWFSDSFRIDRYNLSCLGDLKSFRQARCLLTISSPNLNVSCLQFLLVLPFFTPLLFLLNRKYRHKREIQFIITNLTQFQNVDAYHPTNTEGPAVQEQLKWIISNVPFREMSCLHIES